MLDTDVGSFFAKIWGSNAGHRCVVRQSQSGGMRHLWGSDNDVYKQALGEVNYFFGLFTFKETSRKQVNALTTRAFWLDIDVKDEASDKAYGSIEEAAASLKNFLDSSAFVSPTYIVRSGAGLHVYWCLNEDVDATLWRRKAAKFRALVETSGLKVDHSRTTDPASILRVPGTTNKKPGRSPLSVVILKENSVIDADNFYKALDESCKSTGARTPKEEQAPISRLEAMKDSLLAVQEEDRSKYNADEMAANCAQLGRVKSLRGAVHEPLWYATIQILRFTNNGKETIHEWSKGDPRYSEDATNSKIAQLDEKGIGPTTCDQLRSVGSVELCKDCPHRKTIRSPIQLAVRVAEVTPAAESQTQTVTVNSQEIPVGFTPKGFMLTSGGSLAFKHPETGMMVDFYPYPLFVNRRVISGGGTFHISIDTWLPKDGYMQMTLPMSVCKDQLTLTEELASRGVVCTDGEDKLLRMYIVESIRQLTKQITAVRGYSRYGWDDGVFYIHDEAYSESGAAEAVFTGDSKLCSMRGDINAWDRVFDHYERASTVYKLAFYSGFGAALMEFTGFGGVTYSMVSSESGVGKTTVQSVICAIYGDPDILRAQRTDTYNSLMKRLGIYNSIPLCVDELTNIESAHLSEFVYQVSQGRERSRLTQASDLQEAGSWKTIAVSSSNEMLSSKIMDNRTDSEAELSRLIELYAPAYAPKSELDALNTVVRENYGVVGNKWVQQVARDQKAIKEVIRYYSRLVEKKACWGSQGRFHTAFLAVIATSIALVNRYFNRSVDVDKVISDAIAAIDQSKNNISGVSGVGGSSPTIDEGAMRSFADGENDEELDKEILRRQQKAMATAWLDTLLNYVMPNSVIRKANNRTVTPSLDARFVIDEVNGKLYVPVSVAERTFALARVSTTNLTRCDKKRVKIYEGTEYASSVITLCYEIDISPVQTVLRAAKERVEGAFGMNSDGVMREVLRSRN